MNKTLKKTLPFLLILLSMFLLFFAIQPIPACICLLIGIVIMVEKRWPENWDTNSDNKKNTHKEL